MSKFLDKPASDTLYRAMVTCRTKRSADIFFRICVPFLS